MGYNINPPLVSTKKTQTTKTKTKPTKKPPKSNAKPDKDVTTEM